MVDASRRSRFACTASSAILSRSPRDRTASSRATAPLIVTLLDRFRRTRSVSLELAAPLSAEDMTVQSMDDVSPTKWHLAHTSWFFETFALQRQCGVGPVGEPGYEVIFNSYYNGVGPQYHRPSRGLLTRPGVDEVLAYRARVDEALERELERRQDDEGLARIVELGLQHEQQHQELILTDIQHVLSMNPLAPRYHEPALPPAGEVRPLGWHAFEGGAHDVGHDVGHDDRDDSSPPRRFAYDNESPRHRVQLVDYELADRLVTNGEVRAFIGDGGYERAELWHDEGWAEVRAEQRGAPLYWTLRDGEWWRHSLHGTHPVRDADPATHLSWFEASAIAAWMDARLPTEFEWERAASEVPVAGNFRESAHFTPLAPAAHGAPGAHGDHRDQHANDDTAPRQLFGDCWEWTSSAYSPYPGYRAAPGALGEYNGKFMVNQYVLRGGSCATSADHVRATYRNFFPARARWQFSGLRLARDAR